MMTANQPLPSGPLDRDTAIGLVRHADQLAASGDYETAAAYYSRVVGHQDADLHVAGLLGLGECQYRLDHDAAALQSWTMAARAPETPASWIAWKQVAGAKVRSGDLPGALDAYQQADRRAPPEARAEIASRLGWLNKELGNRGASERYFNRIRVTNRGAPVTFALIGITTVISVLAMYGGQLGDQLDSLFVLDKLAVAHGEYWRLITVTLLHGGLLHLAFNMYALYIVGPLVERIFGPIQYVAIYILCAIGGSIASYIVFPEPAVGASGAIFGLFGVLFVAMWRHHPLLDRQARAVASQIGFLIVFNLGLNVFMVTSGTVAIDIAAHLGGLATGAWLALVFTPGAGMTLAGLWQRPGAPGSPGSSGPPGAPGAPGVPVGAGIDQRGQAVVRVLGVTALLAVFVIGIGIGNASYAAAALVVQTRRTRERAVDPLCCTSRTVLRSSPMPSIEMRMASPGRVVNSGGGTMDVPVSIQAPTGRV
jgi:membrane associated rhomboid family serine protease